MSKMNKDLQGYVFLVTASFLILNWPRSAAATVVDMPRSTGARSTGVRCERNSVHAMAKPHEMRLAQSLRRVTGFGSLDFASDGSLSLGNESAAEGGSAEARRMLIRAICLGPSFIIEDYSGSGSVTFGQAVPEQVYEPRDGTRSQLWRVRLDFEDFQQVEASADVRAAFDEGFTLLHELLHGLGYEDAVRQWELGACEEIVNRMRSELGLPLRERYFGETWRITEKLTSVRLRFRRSPQVGGSARGDSRYLFFLLTQPAQCLANVRAAKRSDKNSAADLDVPERSR